MARCSVTIFTVVSLKPGLCSWHVLKSIFIKSVSRLSWKNTNYHYSLPGFIITTASHTSLYSPSVISRKVILSLQYVASYNKLSAKKVFPKLCSYFMDSKISDSKYWSLISLSKNVQKYKAILYRWNSFSLGSLRETNDYISPLSQHTVYLLYIKRFRQIEQRQVKKRLSYEAKPSVIKEVNYCAYSSTFLHKSAKFSFLLLHYTKYQKIIILEAQNLWTSVYLVH